MNPGWVTPVKLIFPLNVIVCSPGFNGFSKIQYPSETPVPLPAGINTGLFSTAVKLNPPAGESILYCSRFFTSYPSISACRSNALSTRLLAHILWSVSLWPKNGGPSRLSHNILTIGNRIDVPCGIPHSCSGKPVTLSLAEPTRNNNLSLSCNPISQPSWPKSINGFTSSASRPAIHCHHLSPSSDTLLAGNICGFLFLSLYP